MTKSCESCWMPLSKDSGVRESGRYCSLCFKGGRLCYEGSDVREFQRICYAGMRARGMNPWLARLFAFLVRFAPRWRRR